MTHPTRYVIVGNGAAGVSAAETIRELDGAGSIVIVAAEHTPMYSRPGLAYVATGDVPPRQVVAHTYDWYAQMGITLVFARAARLDTDAHMLFLEGGKVVPYDRLLIATGARAVTPDYPGIDLDGVVYLDTLEGTRRLLRTARRGRRAVVIGGGITALEMVEGLAAHKLETHYLLRRDRLWDRVFNSAEGDLLADRMRHHGVIIHPNTEITAVEGNWRGRVAAVKLADGGSMRCDVLGVAIGVRPQLDLVRNTPLAVDRGILVDEHLQSSVADVFAAGDCAQVYDRWSNRHLLDILWPSAVAEGQAAGRNMAGYPTPYVKGTPFNACLLFGLHITAIGQVNPDPGDGDGIAQAQHWSRGSSEVWFTFPRHYRSAWVPGNHNSLRLVLDDTRLVGALIVGDQTLADPLRDLVEWEADASPLLPHLEGDRSQLTARVLALWRALRPQAQPTTP